MKDQNIDKGYLVNEKSKIVGQIRSYDLKSKKAEIMYYNLDVVGYIRGYIPDDCVVMEEKSLRSKKEFAKQLDDAKYSVFKKEHIVDLIEYYEHYPYIGVLEFDKFCKMMYRKHGGD